jgi:hypothetical protein
MLSESSWRRWKQMLSTLCFIALYGGRVLLSHLRYKTRKTSREEIDAWARDYWNQLYPLSNLSKHSNDALQITKKQQVWANPLTAMATLHLGFQPTQKMRDPEELPTQKMPILRPSSTQPEAQKAHHSIDKQKSFTWKMAALLTVAALGVLLLTTFLSQNSVTRQILHAIKATSFSSAPQLTTSDLNTTMQKTSINASRALVRLSQLDPEEYASQNEFNTWAYSACSTTSLTEVFNAYGRHYRITDVLKVEAAIGEITPDLGLIEDVGIANTAAKFGFQTDWGDNWTLKQVLKNANAGRPVIVGWPPTRYEDRHVVVVTGGDTSSVYLADSSLWNRHMISHSQFMQWWTGFAAVITPA